MRITYKEDYSNPESTKDFSVSLLKIFYVEPEFLDPPHDSARWQKYKVKMYLHKQYVENKKSVEQIAQECEVSVEEILPYISKLENGEDFDEFTEDYKMRIDALGYNHEINYHSDFLDFNYKYTEAYENEISEDLRNQSMEAEGVLLQTLWNIYIYDCNFAPGTSPEVLANSVPWSIDTYFPHFGEDVFTKILSAKFSSSFYTKCRILSDLYLNNSSDDSLAEFIGDNEYELGLANRVNAAESLSNLDDDDNEGLECIDETWEQLCETLGVAIDGDYTTLAEMRSFHSKDNLP